jgi:hypothetical protein
MKTVDIDALKADHDALMKGDQETEESETKLMKDTHEKEEGTTTESEEGSEEHHAAPEKPVDLDALKKAVSGNHEFQAKVSDACLHDPNQKRCREEVTEQMFCNLLKRSKPEAYGNSTCARTNATPYGFSSDVKQEKANVTSFSQLSLRTKRFHNQAPEDELAKEMTHDLEMNFNKIAPFGKEDTAKELQDHAAKTQDTLVDAVENAEVAEIKRAVFRALTRLRAATIKEFDTIARLETQAIDAYNDAHHYRAENPLTHLHEDEAPVETDKLKSFH